MSEINETTQQSRRQLIIAVGVVVVAIVALVAILLSTPRCQVARAPFCGARDGPRFRGALVAAEPLAIGFA